MRSVQSTLFTLLAASSVAYADTTLNLKLGVSPIGHDVYDLHMIIFWICVAIVCVVFAAMFYAIFYHRQSRGLESTNFHSDLWLEIAWTIVPILILMLMAIPATKVLLRMNNLKKEELTINIISYQWKWQYAPIEGMITF